MDLKERGSDGVEWIELHWALANNLLPTAATVGSLWPLLHAVSDNCTFHFSTNKYTYKQLPFTL
jgi:hypothetical protein